eukprot:scaffold141584_cov19-Prasinocladus_malaysianus.AAC.1
MESGKHSFNIKVVPWLVSCCDRQSFVHTRTYSYSNLVANQYSYEYPDSFKPEYSYSYFPAVGCDFA